MAVTLDRVDNPFGGGSDTSLTSTHNVIGDPTFITFTCFSLNGTSSQSVTGATYGGVALAQGIEFSYSSPSLIAIVSVWYLDHDIATGAQTTVTTWGGAITNRFFSSMSFTGGGFAGGSGSNSDTSKEARISHSSQNGSIVVGGGRIGHTGNTPFSGTTQDEVGAAISNSARSYSHDGDGSTVTMGYTAPANMGWGMVTFEVRNTAMPPGDGAVPGGDIDDNFPVPPGWNPGYIDVPQYVPRGFLFPNPYFLTKAGIAISNMLNNVSIY